ncbi:PAS domain-containing sensor histidine kinase [Allomuricauda sp. NBRC 101325]|uniref:PAS domain-containing sensor histidine kinase n=1 Tax=Allomuricauda sp. NBRC 101325 TaxID=1113758 RepID=UPI00249FA4BC|nr:PAS domain-containing sensor histidine kinase [Muricauda sp. NBRC 101325]GLU45414.1 hypothetical protein Musp01_30380 [Muricauda sp. NBRC 101325]
MNETSEHTLEFALDPFFDHSLDCLCIASFEGYFLKVNPAFKKLLGYTEKELKSKPIAEFIHPIDRPLTAKERAKLLNNVPLVNFENRYIGKSGEIVWLHWTSISLPEMGLVYAIAKNVTYKKKLESDRALHIQRLSVINEELKKQNYATAHDLRAPLNNLMSLVALIDHTKINDIDNREIIQLIQQSALGLETTLNAYLDSYKDTDSSKRQLSQVVFQSVIQNIQSAIGSLINASKTKFELDFKGLEQVIFNPHFMESILLNLITNSIKYAKPGITPIISINTAIKDGVKTLVYRDNGIGFDMEKVGHLIFNLNETFHDNKDSKGVGLYLVYNQVTSMGGSITVDSQVNMGTTFTIRFAR